MIRRVRVAASAAGAIGAAALVAIACSDDPHLRTSPEQALGGGGACAATAGQLPTPNCDDSTNTCTAASPACPIDEAKCGSESTCLPIGDNTGKTTQDFRIRRLKIATPEALAGDLIQNTVVTLNIDLADKECGELGKGLFSWLLRIDRTAGTLTTGGAPPPADALGQGFCFARFQSGELDVAPITTKIDFTGDTFKSLDPQKLKIPIFLSDDIGSVVLLPITDVRLEGVTVSENGNCIGKLNPLALDSMCSSDYSSCSKWQTAGSLGGYITLEEADAVKIRDLNNKSLCSLLSSETLTCARDASGKILFKGDYCSVDKQPASCGDSMWLAATFAASAAKIFDGQGSVQACSGAVATPDAGPDAASDAGADAATDAGDGG